MRSSVIAVAMDFKSSFSLARFEAISFSCFESIKELVLRSGGATVAVLYVAGCLALV